MGGNYMLILAKSCKGSEFLYSAKSAHAVSKASAAKIRDIVNQYKYKLSENEVWHIHEVSYYDDASFYAERQKFTIRKGIVKEQFC